MRPPSARSSSSAWPSTPLDCAERAFAVLTQEPTPLRLDARTVPGLPEEGIGLDQLRAVLLRPLRPEAALRDRVWAELVRRARHDGPAWMVIAVGVALPGLRRAAGRLTAGWRGDSHDIDAELLVGFVARVHTIDIDQPRICGRLIDAGVRAGRKARDADTEARLLRHGGAESLVPAVPWGHPDLVLARAVTAEVIDAQDANLISATRLESVTLALAAAQLGITPQTARARRACAERRLVAAIHAGDLAMVPLRPSHTRPFRPVGRELGSATPTNYRLGTQPRPLGVKTAAAAAAVAVAGIGSRPV